MLVNGRTLLPVPMLPLELSEVPTSSLYKRHMSPDRGLAAAVTEAL